MLSHHSTGVSLPALRLILGLTALAISFYYNFLFISVGTSGFELLSALAFVCITEATKAMYSHDIAYYSMTRQGDKTIFAGLIVFVLFALSITATVYFLLANPLKDDVKLQTNTEHAEQIKNAISAKQMQLNACNQNYLTKCVNPRTDELNKLQSDLNAVLTHEAELTAIQANKAFWSKAAVFAGTDADNLQMYFAIVRGVLLEVIGLALIAQATASNKIQSVGYHNAIREEALTDEKQALLAEISRLNKLLTNDAKQ